MYVCYIDESGTSDIPGTTSHFILAGISVPIRHWRAIDKAICILLKRYGLEDAELHTAWILRKYPEQLRIPDFEKLDRAARRAAVERQRTIQLLALQNKQKSNYRQVKKDFAHTRAYIHLTFKERKNLVVDAATLISKWSSLRLFAECIDKTYFNPASFRSVDEQAFEQVVSRFEQYLVNTEESHNRNYGLLVHDNNDTVARKHTALMRQFHAKGTLWTNITRIIDTPLFVNSSLTSMVQIADLCAYSLRRYLENGEKELFQLIFARADKIKAHNTVVGVRHFADLGCDCLVCQAHKGAPTVALKSKTGMG
jgi:Protein of unknown function (DUF3800)